MSNTNSSVDSTDGPKPTGWRALRRKLPTPMQLYLLGLISIPGYLFASLRPLQWFALFFFFGFWPIISSLLPSFGAEGTTPTGWIRIGDTQQKWRTIVSFLLIQLNPFVLVKGLLQLGGQLVVLARYGNRLPNPERFEQSVSYDVPFADVSFDGSADDPTAPELSSRTWTVVNGSPTREGSHSWGILTQRYAYDFVITDEDGRTHTGDGSRPAEYYCFGKPIYAAADGVVVETHDGHRDHQRTNGWLDVLQRDVRGNWVTIEHADGEYSVSAHLQCDSVAVNEGERVTRGQQIGRCGHSGNSSEPHLHFHVQDRPNFYLGMGLPIQFDGLVAYDGGKTNECNDSRAPPERRYVTAGQRVIPTAD